MRLVDLTAAERGPLVLDGWKPSKTGSDGRIRLDLHLSAGLEGEGDIQLPALFGPRAVTALEEAADEEHGRSSLLQVDPLIEVNLTIESPQGLSIWSGPATVRRCALHAVPKNPRAVFLVRVECGADELPKFARSIGAGVIVASTGPQQGKLPLDA